MTRRFGKDEEFNSGFVKWFCLEVTCGYLFAPTDRVAKTVFSSIINRFICHLFEESAGIYDPKRVVFAAQALDIVERTKRHLSACQNPQPVQFLNLFLAVASLALLCAAAPRKARLVSIYKVVIDRRTEVLRLLNADPQNEGDLGLARAIEATFPENLSAPCEDPLYVAAARHFHRTKTMAKSPWVSAVEAEIRKAEGQFPGIRAAYCKLAAPWHAKRDRPVFTYPPVFINALHASEVKKSAKPSTLSSSSSSSSHAFFDEVGSYPLTQKPMSQGIQAIFLQIKRHVLQDTEKHAGHLLEETRALIDLISDVESSFDWNAFVRAPGYPVPDVIKDIHTGQKGRDHQHFAMVAAVVPDQDQQLTATQQLLLRAYERSHVLSDGKTSNKRDRNEEDLDPESKFQCVSPPTSSSSISSSSISSSSSSNTSSSTPTLSNSPSSSSSSTTFTSSSLNSDSSTALIKSMFVPMPEALIQEMESCPRGQRATGKHKHTVYILKAWENGRFIVKSVSSHEMAAKIHLRTQILAKWRPRSIPVVTHFFERGDGKLFLAMPHVGDPATLHCPGAKDERFAMINEGDAVCAVVEKASQGLQEFSAFMKSADVASQKHRQMIAEAALLFFCRYLLGIGDPALRNALVRVTDGQVFMIDFDENTGRTDSPKLGSPPRLAELIFGKIGRSIGRADAALLTRACAMEMGYLVRELADIQQSFHDQTFLRLVVSLGFPESLFNQDRLIELCQIFQTSLEIAN